LEPVGKSYRPSHGESPGRKDGSTSIREGSFQKQRGGKPQGRGKNIVPGVSRAQAKRDEGSEKKVVSCSLSGGGRKGGNHTRKKGWEKEHRVQPRGRRKGRGQKTDNFSRPAIRENDGKERKISNTKRREGKSALINPQLGASVL